MKNQEKPDWSHRFWKFVDKKEVSECWNWKGGINSTGRGIFWINNKTIHAHRASWILEHKEIPKGMFVLHHCDNGKCVNPNHLFLGTQYDNIHDMERKGRAIHLRGDNDPKSKLTTEKVIRIRQIYSRMEASQMELAKEFGVSRSTIEEVLHRNTWKHVL